MAFGRSARPTAGLKPAAGHSHAGVLGREMDVPCWCGDRNDAGLGIGRRHRALRMCEFQCLSGPHCVRCVPQSRVTFAVALDAVLKMLWSLTEPECVCMVRTQGAP